MFRQGLQLKVVDEQTGFYDTSHPSAIFLQIEVDIRTDRDLDLEMFLRTE